MAALEPLNTSISGECHIFYTGILVLTERFDEFVNFIIPSFDCNYNIYSGHGWRDSKMSTGFAKSFKAIYRGFHTVVIVHSVGTQTKDNRAVKY